MENSLSDALSILLTGMITVLIILGLVVVVGNLLIRITNKYFRLPQNGGKNGTIPGSIPAGTMAAIIAAVETVTGGKGKIIKIEKE
jgi:oxaloacetate decarboxylase gamma subunit